MAWARWQRPREIAFYELNRSTSKLHSLDRTFKEFITGMVKMEKDFDYAHKKLDKALEDNLLTLTECNQALAILEEREKKRPLARR